MGKGLYRLQIDLSPYLEYMQEIPYYPYSLIGGGVLLLLLLVAMRKKKPAKPPASRITRRPAVIAAKPIDGLSASGELIARPADIPVVSYQPVDTPVESVIAAPLHVSAEPLAPTLSVSAAQPIRTSQPAPMESTIRSSRNKALRDKFQELYFDIYFELGLSTDFEQMRNIVEARLDQQAGVSTAAPDILVFQQIADGVEDMLKSGKYHLDKGALGPHGQELFNVYRYALGSLQAKGQISNIESRMTALEHQLGDISPVR